MNLSELKAAVDAAIKGGDMPVIIKIDRQEVDADKAAPWFGPEWREQPPQFYIEAADE